MVLMCHLVNYIIDHLAALPQTEQNSRLKSVADHVFI